MAEEIEFYITPQTLREINNLQEVNESLIADKGKELWDTLPYVAKLAITCFIARSLQQSQSYRYWIYHKLGLKEDAYAPVYLNGGMNITNAMVGWFDKNPE